MKVTGEVASLPHHLSPSSISTWEQCPLRYRFSRLDKIAEPPTEAQHIGSMTHEILEALYKEPTAHRTTATARRLAAQLWTSKWEDEVKVLGLSSEDTHRFRWNVWWCVEALFAMEDPTTVELAGIEHPVTTTIGDVTLLGIIDRWEEDDGGLVKIGDYKTGKKPRPQYEGEKKFQLTVYKSLVEDSLDREVSRTELLYLKEGIRWEYVPTEEDVVQMKSTVTRVWDELTAACTTGIFEAKPSVLCGWCSYKNMCPAWVAVI